MVIEFTEQDGSPGIAWLPDTPNEEAAKLEAERERIVGEMKRIERVMGDKFMWVSPEYDGIDAARALQKVRELEAEYAKLAADLRAVTEAHEALSGRAEA